MFNIGLVSVGSVFLSWAVATRQEVTSVSVCRATSTPSRMQSLTMMGNWSRPSSQMWSLIPKRGKIGNSWYLHIKYLSPRIKLMNSIKYSYHTGKKSKIVK